MRVYVIAEEIHNAHRVVMVSKNLQTCGKAIRKEYNMDREDWLYFLAWKEYYLVMSDTKLQIEEIEMDKYQQL